MRHIIAAVIRPVQCCLATLMAAHRLGRDIFAIVHLTLVVCLVLRRRASSSDHVSSIVRRSHSSRLPCCCQSTVQTAQINCLVYARMCTHSSSSVNPGSSVKAPPPMPAPPRPYSPSPVSPLPQPCTTNHQLISNFLANQLEVSTSICTRSVTLRYSLL